MSENKLKVKHNMVAWSINHIPVTENFTCLVLLATGVFHNSHYGQEFSRLFKTGDDVTITITRVEPRQ